MQHAPITFLAAGLMLLPGLGAGLGVPDAVPVPWWDARPVPTTRDLGAVAALGPDEVLVGGERGVAYVTSDAGGRWHVSRTGLSGHVLDFSFLTPRHGWALTEGGGIAYTADGGRSWTPQRASEEEGWYAHVLALPDGRVFVPAQATNRFPVVLTSRDAGATWEHVIAPVDQQQAGLFDVAFDEDGRHGVAVGSTWVGRGYVVTTADGGESWDFVTSGLPRALRAVAWTSGSRVVAVGDAGKAYVSDDAGRTWTGKHTGTLEHLNGLALSADGSGYATGRVGTVLWTPNAGDTWIPAHPPKRDAVTDADLGPGGELWITQGRGQVLVRNHGLALSDVTSTLPPLRLTHAPIVIVGNDGFRSPLSGVTSGSGSRDDPYVIEGWSFTPLAADAITVRDTTAHVVIRQNVFQNGIEPHVGIRLTRADNVRIESNGFHGNAAAIAAENCAELTISDNALDGHGSGAAAIVDSSGVTVSNNSVTHNARHGLAFTRVGELRVAGNVFYATAGPAVAIENGRAHNNVSGNTFTENRVGVNATVGSGLTLWDNDFVFSEDTGARATRVDAVMLAHNTFSGNERIGVYVNEVNEARLMDNAFTDQPVHVRIEASRNGTYEQNTFEGGFHAFQAWAAASANTFRGNTLRGVYAGGVFLPDADENVFTGNVVEDSHYFFAASGNRGSRFEHNVFRNSTWGLDVDGTVAAVISNNTFEDAWEGPDAGSFAQGTIIENNTLKRVRFGISSAGTDSTIRGNVVNDSEWSGITVSGGRGARIIDNAVRGAGTAGILVRDHDDAFVARNTVTDSGSGMKAHSNNQAVKGVHVEANVFTRNARGLHVDHDRANVENASFHGNSISGNAVGLEVTAGRAGHAPVDARRNWWGASDGPAGIGPGSGDAITVSGDAVVEYDPWLVEEP